MSGGGRFNDGRPRSRASEPPEVGSAAVDAEPDPEEVARAILLRRLTGAPRSRAQLAEALARKDVPEEVAERVLDRFTEVGLIDDAEYARTVVRSRHAEKGLARRALATDLRRRGIDEPTAAQALAQVDDDDELAAARALVERRLAATRGLDAQVRMRRTCAALGRRGYPPGLVVRLVREALAREGESVPADAGDDAGDG